MSNSITWRQALNLKRFRAHAFISLVAAALILSSISYFFNHILLPKPGIVLDDFILNLFTPIDWSWIIFGLIYSSVLLTIGFNYTKPFVILLGIETYVAVNLFRFITLYAITLEPPVGIIALIDPVITKIAYGDVVYLKDLFFSGHVATMTLLFLLEQNRFRKTLLAITTLLVAFFILWQHVHYSVDVLFAPLFTWFIFSLIQRIQRHHFREA